jgi:hypothetical protein
MKPMVDFRSEATRILSEIRKGSTFLTVKHYMNNFGEISDFSIVFHISYRNAIEKSRDILDSFRFKPEDLIGKSYTLEIAEIARLELIESFQATLAGKAKSTSAHAYSAIDNGEGEAISGVKLHDTQDLLHITGFRVHKNILFPGNYPPDNRGLKTIAKDDLKKDYLLDDMFNLNWNLTDFISW